MALDTPELLVIPKPAYAVLRRLTGASRPDVALNLALKDLVRLRLEAARATASALEHKYSLSFDDFSQQWRSGNVSSAHSYEVEQDYWSWEGALSDIQALEELAEWLV